MNFEHNIPILISQFISTDSANVDDTLNESTKFLLELSTLIVSDKLTLLQFIQELGSYLTSDNDSIRSKALNCLASTLSHLLHSQNSSKVSKHDITILIDFLLSKFDDTPTFQFVLLNLNYLIKFKYFIPSISSSKLLLKLLNSYNPKQFLAKIRYQTFKIIENLLITHKSFYVLSSENSDLLIKTFISIAEGEKDPRNLLLSFTLNTLINQNFTFDDTSNDTHKQFLNDLFDISFCYFPISFSPPSNDPYKITSKQLKLKLTETISSQSKFTPDSFNSLVEKLTSTNPIVRNDVLITLLACIEKYDTNTIETYWLDIWNAIKFELLHRSDSLSIFKSNSLNLIPENYLDLDDNDENKSLYLALTIIQKLLQRLLNQANFDKILIAIVDELKPNLSEINDKAKPSILILSVLASQSKSSFNSITNSLFEYQVWGKFINSDEKNSSNVEININEDFNFNIEKQRALVDLFGFLFTAYYQLNSKDDENSLVQYKSHILVFFSQLFDSSTTMETTLKTKIIEQFIKLIQIDSFLNSSELSLIFGYFNNIISNENINWNDSIVNQLVSGLVSISEYKPTLIIDNILPQLLFIAEKSPSLQNVAQVLKVISDICTTYQFLEVLSIRFISILQNCENIELIQLVIEMFINLIKKIQTRNQFLTNSWFNAFAPAILKLYGDDSILVERIGDLVGLLIRFCDVSKHQSLIDQYHRQFSYTLENPSIAVGIFTKILASSDKSVTHQEISYSALIELIHDIDDNYLKVSYLQFLALSVNKVQDIEDLESMFALAQKSKKDLEIFVWVLKGLLLKLDKAGLEYLEKLITTFTSTNDDLLKVWISHALQILFVDLQIFSNPVPQVKIRGLISKVNSLNVKSLYKQQIFEIVLPKLIISDEKPVLVGLSLIMNNLGNESIIKPHLEQIVPSTLKSLGEKDSSIIESSLSTLKIIIDQNVKLITNDLKTIIPILEDFISTKIIINRQQVNVETVRLSSVEILSQLFNNYEIRESLLKYKSTCLKRLTIGLDDNKRSVRKACADLCQILYEM